MQNKELPSYKYKGARSLVILQEKHLLAFYETWKLAYSKNIILPITEDPDYESLNTLLRHVLRSAGNYMKWICEKLELPNPNIIPPPEPELLSKNADEYINHILEKWKSPLSKIKEEKFHAPTFTSNWGVEYCIDAMLEHAVMHPIRHEFQLQNLILENYEK
jgi:hypothetical protein